MVKSELSENEIRTYSLYELTMDYGKKINHQFTECRSDLSGNKVTILLTKSDYSRLQDELRNSEKNIIEKDGFLYIATEGFEIRIPNSYSKSREILGMLVNSIIERYPDKRIYKSYVCDCIDVAYLVIYLEWFNYESNVIYIMCQSLLNTWSGIYAYGSDSHIDNIDGFNLVDSKVIKETIEGFRVYKLNFNDVGIPYVK